MKRFKTCLIIITLAAIIPFSGIVSKSSVAQPTNDNVIPEQIAQRAKAYFEVISLITIALSKPECEQIRKELDIINTPVNQTKMDFDISALRGDISQTIKQQYDKQVQAYLAANSNYLTVCKHHPSTLYTNAALHELFKLSVASVNRRYARYKAREEERIAKFKAEEEERKAKLKAEEEERKRKKEEKKRKKEYQDYKDQVTSQICNGYIDRYNNCIAGVRCGFFLKENSSGHSIANKCSDCCNNTNNTPECISACIDTYRKF